MDRIDIRQAGSGVFAPEYPVMDADRARFKAERGLLPE
jgi:hypothetical protein